MSSVPEMAQLHQWMVLCTICKSPAHHHCNTCGDILCSNCKDMHLKSKATRNHQVVLYSERLDSATIYGFCEAHSKLECRLWCKTCSKIACFECVTSDEHSGHLFNKLSALLEEKREIVKKEYEKKTASLKIWKESLKDLQSMQEAFDSDIANQDKNINERVEEICREFTKIRSQKRTQLQGIKTSAYEMFQKNEKILTDGISKMEQDCEGLEEKLRSNNTSDIILHVPDTERQLQRKPPTFKPPKVPGFFPTSLNLDDLAESFGINEDDLEKQDHSNNTKGVGYNGQSFFVPIFNIVSIDRMTDLKRIACVGSDQAWIKRGDESLSLFSRTGEMMRKVQTVSDVFAVTKEGELIFIHNNIIQNASDEILFKFPFKTEDKVLFSVCCLQDGSFVVTLPIERRVVGYNASGKIFEIDQSVLRHPILVGENKVNQHIYISDWSVFQTNYLPTPGRMMAFDTSYRLLYTYHGVDDSGFTPFGICSDHLGNILIADVAFHRIHFLDKDGKFLRYFLTLKQELFMPSFIDIDGEGYVWILEAACTNVKIVKYLDQAL